MKLWQKDPRYPTVKKHIALLEVKRKISEADPLRRYEMTR